MGSMFGQQINPVQASSLVGQGTQNAFTNALFYGGLGLNTSGGMNNATLQGVPGYGGQLSPDINQTLLPSVYSVYNAGQMGNGGSDWLTNMLAQNPSGNNMPAPYAQAQQNLMQYGGIGGYPTQLMSLMAQYGGTGGLGNQSMSNLAQKGYTGQAGPQLNQMAMSGSSGSWGNQLQSLANGDMNSGAAKYLAPFLTAKPYSAFGQAPAAQQPQATTPKQQPSQRS